MTTASKSESAQTPVVLLFGPTAVGKTELLLDLLGGRAEVVSADSMQVYRRMDVGTAKPPAGVTVRLPHHLIDVRDPDEEYSVGDFVRDADLLVPEILSRGRMAVVSGGSAFYLQNFVYGLPETPRADREVKSRLAQEYELRGVEALRAELERVDPETAARLPAADRYRIVRALEVYRSTGRPLSSFRRPHVPRSGYRFLVIGLERDRSDLYRRIDRRVQMMFDRGLTREVAGLLEAGYGFDLPAMRAIGYREFIGYFNGTQTLEQTIELIRRNSRRYAKRQITFFKQLPDAVWFFAEDRDGLRSLLSEFADRTGFADS